MAIRTQAHQVIEKKDTDHAIMKLNSNHILTQENPSQSIWMQALLSPN